MRKLIMVFGLTIAVVVAVGAAPARAQTLDEQEPADSYPGLVAAEPLSEEQQWYWDNVIIPERQEAYGGDDETAPLDVPPDAITLTPACGNESYAAEWITGTSGSDTLIYGEIYAGSGLIKIHLGLGACRFAHGAGGPCQLGAFSGYVYYWTSPASYPLGIRGDPTGAGYGGDFIAPASFCGAGLTTCGTSGGTTYSVGAPRSGSRFHVCGDDCSVSYGAADGMIGWDNRDLLMGSAGGDGAYGGGGSDCIWGDNGGDIVEGEDCDAATTEEIHGGNDVDNLYGYVYRDTGGGAACPRKIWADGGGGVQRVYGGPGDDYLWGGPGANDVLIAGPGDDHLNGGNGDNDWCDGNAGTNVCDACEDGVCN